MMIQATELAKQVIAQALYYADVGPDRGLRLRREGDLILELDEATDNDRVLTHDRKVVLIISREVEEELGPGLIDVQETDCGNDLVLRHKADERSTVAVSTRWITGQN